MHYLTIEQRESLQAALNARAAALRESIAQALGGEGAQSLPDHREDTDDDAVMDLESSLEVNSLERNSLELREVEKSLVRLHSPEYGECADCGEDIPFTRLQANPLATRCKSCQAAHERAHPGPVRSSL
jgi:DnaK suppressor protein